MMYEDFIRRRIAELRERKGISEYQLSYAIERNRGGVEA